jgi:hypothetical protein
MEARIGDNPLRWGVTSRSRPEITHLVELDAFGGIGTCSCEHFQFRIAPDLREGQRIGSSRCSHILVARAAFTDAMIQTLIRAKTPPPPTICPHCGDGIETPGAAACNFCTEINSEPPP